MRNKNEPVQILTFLKRNYRFTGYISSWVSSELCANFAHVNTTPRGFDWLFETMVLCRFNLRGPRVLQDVLLTNWGRVPPRVLVCQHAEVTKPISTVVVSCLKCTRRSAIVLSFHWGHEEPPGVDLRAAIVWLENLNERSTFALEFCGGFVAVGTF